MTPVDQFNSNVLLIKIHSQAIAIVSIHQSEAAPKLALIKAKLALAKAPHIIAKIAVAKEVKAKTKIAAAKSIAAVSI